MIGFLWACGEEVIEVSPEATNAGKEYYPLKVGQYTEYGVTQINHKELVDDDTMEFFLRQEITGVEEGGQYPVYRLELSKRNTLNSQWQVDSVWTVRDEGNRLVQAENNVPFVKMIFPLQEGLNWDGNSFNIRNVEEYEAMNIGQAYILGPINNIPENSFENTLTIIQHDSYTLIDQDSRREVYAAGVGLIHKKRETYQYINDSQSPYYAQDSIIAGIFYEQTLIAYGE